MTIVYISKQGEEFQTSGPNVLNLGSVQRIQFLDRPIASNQINREIYVAVALDQGFEPAPRYSGFAARIQVEEMAEDKLKKSFYIRKGTGAFSPPAIYDGLCRRFTIETQPNGSAKLIYVSQDGNTFPPTTIYKVDGDVLTEFVPMAPTPPSVVPLVTPLQQYGYQVFVYDDQYYITGQQQPTYVTGQQPPIAITPTIQPDPQSGELKISQVTAHQPGSDPNLTTDGNPNTYWEGTGYLQADLGGIGAVKTLKLKFRGQATFTIHTSLDEITWFRVPLGTITNEVSIPGDEEFEYFTFPSEIPSRYIRIVPEPFGSKASVITFKVLQVDPTNKPPVGSMAQQQGNTIYAVTGQTNDKFKHWGRHKTNYASGGSGPSERWNCDAQYLNCEATLKFNIGDPRKDDDNISIKFRGGSHDDENGGWIIVGVKFNGEAQFGKENPHPKTEHYDANEKPGEKIPGGIKNKDVYFKGIIYNDSSGAPIAEAWYRLSENENWKFMGSFRDTGQKPGKVCDRIGIKGSKKQQIQVRVDEAPKAKLISATVAELSVPITKN
jgi:hypothetical protein